MGAVVRSRPQRLDDDHLAVLGRVDLELREAPEDVVAQVRQHQPTATEPIAPVAQRPVIEVGWDRLVEGGGFADEKVAPPGDVDQRIGPLGVAGVGDRLALDGDAVGVRRRVARVEDRVRVYS